jgi:hypothetical protein
MSSRDEEPNNQRDRKSHPETMRPSALKLTLASFNPSPYHESKPNPNPILLKITNLVDIDDFF